MTRKISIENVSDRHCPEKSWGWEEWIVNNDLYCGKRLHFTTVDRGTSLHFHMRKHETMYVESGAFLITTIDPVHATPAYHCLRQGDSIVIEPGTVHRIEACELVEDKAVLVEFSTHHEDADSYRVQK